MRKAYWCEMALVVELLERDEALEYDYQWVNLLMAMMIEEVVALVENLGVPFAVVAVFHVAILVNLIGVADQNMLLVSAWASLKGGLKCWKLTLELIPPFVSKAF